MKRIAWLLVIGLAVYVLVTDPSAVKALGQSLSKNVKSVQPLVSAGASYRDVARQDAANAGIPADYFVRQVNEESGFDPGARGADGEVGLCQFLPSTAAGLGINPSDPIDCLKGMAAMMGRYYRRYGDYAKALAGYNCGGGCLAAAVRYWNWGCHVPRSTQTYIYDIMDERVCNG
jgi:soluble lytic murein transglycosylase-like protein